MQIWERVWNATKDASDGSAKKIADFTFAHWTHLLASLGRKDTLNTLYEETQNRTFDGGPLQQIVNQAKNGYRMMTTEPGECFKCGTFSLNQVAQAMEGAAFDPKKSMELVRMPSPPTGFTMTKLVELATKYNLDLVAASWGDDKKLVVPSVVHWKENHYVAVLKEDKGHYFVADPTFGRPRWLLGADIMEEASGYFMVPKDKLPNDWKILTTSETDGIYGQGYVEGADDDNDSCGNGSGGGNGAGGGLAGGGGGGGGGEVGVASTCTRGVCRAAHVAVVVAVAEVEPAAMATVVVRARPG